MSFLESFCFINGSRFRRLKHKKDSANEGTTLQERKRDTKTRWNTWRYFRRERNLMSRYYERILLLNFFISDKVVRSFNLSFAPSAFPKGLYSSIHHPDILYYAFAHFILRFIVAENIFRREGFCFSPVTRASIFSSEMKLKRSRMAYLKPRLLVRTHRQLLDLAFIAWFIAAFTRRVSTEGPGNLPVIFSIPLSVIHKRIIRIIRVDASFFEAQRDILCPIRE